MFNHRVKKVSDVMQEVTKWQSDLELIAEESDRQVTNLQEELNIALKESADAKKIGANLNTLLGG